MIRAVLFDLGGVVLESPMDFIARFERKHGLPEHAVSQLIGDYARRSDGLWHRLERGEIGIQQFYRLFAAAAAAVGVVKIPIPELMRGIERHGVVRPLMLRAVRTIRQRGLKVGVITNNWLSEDNPDRFESLRAEFHVFVESWRLGRRKPETDMYEFACRELAIQPPDAVFLDDIGANLKAARALGMSTVKVSDPALALGELATLIGVNSLP